MKISGKGLSKEAAKRLGKYVIRREGGWEIDTGGIDERMKQYFEEAAAADKYSIAGLCIALGITRETLELWRAGYACGPDAGGKRSPNEALAQCIAKGELYVHRFWEESDKSTTLHTKLLECAGVLGTAKQTGRRPPFELGGLKKYCR